MNEIDSLQKLYYLSITQIKKEHSCCECPFFEKIYLISRLE